MDLDLTPHPETPPRAVTGVDVFVGTVKAGRSELRFAVTGPGVVLPPETASERTDELWKHTCFEAFVTRDGGGYREFNFAPTTQWAAYDFDSYRAGMRNADVTAPRIYSRRGHERFELYVPLDLPGEGPWRVALTAVIEEADGTKSYWALRHAPGKPDFHHADGFVLELP